MNLELMYSELRNYGNNLRPSSYVPNDPSEKCYRKRLHAQTVQPGVRRHMTQTIPASASGEHNANALLIQQLRILKELFRGQTAKFAYRVDYSLKAD